VPINVRRRRFPSSNELLPYTKVAANRAVRTTIGQELKALYEAPRDLPHEMTTLLMHLNRAETVLKMQTVRRRNKCATP
jgi:hypothetical protein